MMNIMVIDIRLQYFFFLHSIIIINFINIMFITKMSRY